MKTIIFHSPRTVDRESLSGSALRPKAMLEAFERIGVELLVIEGNSRQRLSIWEKVLRSPQSFLGVYSELSTLPIALTDPDHLPRHPKMDSTMFIQCRNHGIPVTAYYRDVFWQFPQYANEFPFFTRWAIKIIGIPFYRLELHQLRKSVSHLFVPSKRMVEYMSPQLPDVPISELPPGGYIRKEKNEDRSQLNLLYIGGVIPPTYNLEKMLSVVNRQKDVTLTLCCRLKDWQIASKYYRVGDNVKIVHASGEELNKHYSVADVFLMYWDLDPYMQLAMPVKLFEAIGAGLPIITNADCEAGDFVSTTRTGWSISNESELSELICRLASNRMLLKDMYSNIETIRYDHTWESRAEKVIDVITRLRHNSSSG